MDMVSCGGLGLTSILVFSAAATYLRSLCGATDDRLTFDQGDTLSDDHFFVSDRSNLFASFCFHIDLPRIDSQDFRNLCFHRLFEMRKLGTLGEHDAIDVSDLEFGTTHLIGYSAQHISRVPASVPLVGVGKHFADVSQSGRSQQRIGYGME